ncbi:MAG: polymer-forming cytoskeletal protein [Bacteroidales bacterium]
MSKQKEPDHTAVNLVGSGTTINGKVSSKGDIRIDGKIIGEVRSEGKVVIGDTGEVEGEIFCLNADFSGKVNGKAEIGELLSLKASSVFWGDIVTNKLAIEPGASFSGTCSMEKDKAPKQPKQTDSKKAESA